MTLEKCSKCPICKKPSIQKFFPFCSSRCSNLDLGRWFGEGYRLPSNDDQGDESDLPSKLDDD